MSIVLSDLYTATERYHEAMAVHEETLRLLLSSDVDSNHAEAALIAKKHIRHLKQVSQRAGMSTPDFFQQNTELLEQLMGVFGEDSVREDVQPSSTGGVERPYGRAIPGMTTEQDDEAAEILFTPRKGHRRRV